MCNRFVQNGQEVRPGQRCVVKMRGPGGEWAMEYDGAVFGGAAKSEKRKYWLMAQRAEEVRIPGVSRFGERNKQTGQQNFEEVTPDSVMEGLLLPSPAGKDYRLLKVVTQPATAAQMQHLGNDRAPVFAAGGEPLARTSAPPQGPAPLQGELF
jgi:hypothetical protein